MLRGLLNWQRATLLWKCNGLTADELVRSLRTPRSVISESRVWRSPKPALS
jgi:hypothetical protein